MKYPYFSTVDKKTHSEIGRKGGLTRRSKAVQKAWDMADKIKQEYKTGNETHRSLADKYKISRMTIKRIISS